MYVVNPSGSASFGKCSDDIVCFDTGDANHRDAKGIEKLKNKRDLRAQVFRHRLAGSLCILRIPDVDAFLLARQTPRQDELVSRDLLCPSAYW